MREILTILAACLVAVLTAALAVPPLIDWDAQRGRIEARLTDDLGGRTTIEGPVSLRLLPAPRLNVGALSVERPGLTLRSRSASFELSPTALLRGRFDFAEASLDGADAALSPADFAPPSAAQVSVQRLTLNDATLRIGGAQPFVLRHLDLTAAADSLGGPFRGSGRWRDGRRLDVSFSTGAVEGGKMRGKLMLDDAAAPAHAEFDGEASVAGGEAQFAGAAVATSAGKKGETPPWRTTFTFNATARALRADTIDLRLGDDDHALTATGSAAYEAGAAVVKLAARNLDLDRFRAAYATLPPPGAPAWPIVLDLSADSATVGGDTLAGVAVSVNAVAGSAPRIAFDSDLPGRSHVHYNGEIDVARDLRADGDLRLLTRDPATLAIWLAPVAPDIARFIGASPFARTEVAAHVRRDGDGGLEAQIEEANLDRSRVTGAMNWTPARDNARARLTARLTSPALDIDGLPTIGAQALPRGFDFAFDLDAQAVKIARVGAGSANAGRIRLRATRRDDVLTLDDISIVDLGGANLTGAGRFAARGGGLDLKLDAERLGDLAALARRVAPSPATEAFFARAPALSPAHLTFGIATTATSDIADINLGGVVGATNISARLHPARGDAQHVEATARAESADASVLLRQLGFAVLPLKGFGAGVIDAQGQGVVGQPMTMRARAAVAGAQFDFSGESTLTLDRAAANGALSLTSADLAPLIRIFALGAPDMAQKLPARGEARLALTPDAVDLDKLALAIGAANVTGRMTRGRDRTISGALSVDVLSAPFLAALALGPPQPAAVGALWPQLKFSPSTFDLPVADLDVSAATVDLGGATGADAHVKLSLAPGALAFRDLRMRLNDGTLSGEGSLRRDGAAVVKARLTLDNVAVASPPFAARVSGQLDASGAGASASELVASLAGSGRVRLAQGRIARAATDALPRIVADADGDLQQIDQGGLSRGLATALDQGVQTLEPFESDLVLAAGRLNFASSVTRASAASARIAASLDLRSGAVDVQESLATPAPQGWAGGPPSIGLSWTGAAGSPTRAIAVDTLVSVLSDHAIARETARNEALEADIRERAFFNRRLKSDRRFDADRRAEAEAARIEAERADKARAEKDSRNARPDDGAVERRPVERRSAPSAFAPAPGGAAPDPSTAGRY